MAGSSKPLIVALLAAVPTSIIAVTWWSSALDMRVRVIAGRLDAIDGKDGRLAKLDDRMGQVEKGVAALGERVTSVQTQLGGIERQLTEIRNVLYRPRAEALGIRPASVESVSLDRTATFTVKGTFHGTEYDASFTVLGIRDGRIALAVNGRIGGVDFVQSMFILPLRVGELTPIAPEAGVYMTLLEPPRQDAAIVAVGQRSRPTG